MTKKMQGKVICIKLITVLNYEITIHFISTWKGEIRYAFLTLNAPVTKFTFSFFAFTKEFHTILMFQKSSNLTEFLVKYLSNLQCCITLNIKCIFIMTREWAMYFLLIDDDVMEWQISKRHLPTFALEAVQPHDINVHQLPHGPPHTVTLSWEAWLHMLPHVNKAFTLPLAPALAAATWPRVVAHWPGQYMAQYEYTVSCG